MNTKAVLPVRGVHKGFKNITVDSEKYAWMKNGSLVVNGMIPIRKVVIVKCGNMEPITARCNSYWGYGGEGYSSHLILNHTQV